MAPSTMIQISRSDINNLNFFHPASITSVKELSSYSWINGETPTIAVPGLPPLWTPLKGSQTLDKDSGFVYIDQNTARHPESSMEPLIRSLVMKNPSFDLRSVNVITDRNNIRKLLHFINPNRDSHKTEVFTINIEVTENTAILGRVDTATSEFIESHEFRGFGREFETRYTTDELSGMKGHHRIISYRFCDMLFIVRYETDGYIKSMASVHQETEDDKLSKAVENLSLASRTTVPYGTLLGSRLRLRECGHMVPTESILEIKTRAARRSLDIDEVAPQLWVSQTPNLVRAYHNKGTFFEPRVEDVSGHIRAWEAANQPDLTKLGALIKWILTATKQVGGKATLKCDVAAAKLVILQNEGLTNMLPKDLYAKWNNILPLRRDGGDSHEGIYEGSPLAPHVIDSKQPFDRLIQVAVDKGFRQLFRDMPTNVGDYLELCDALKASHVDVLQGRQVRDLMNDLRSGKEFWDLEGYYEGVMSKNLSRDSAFRLLYLFLKEEVADKNSAYHATLFVVSHSRLFGPKARMMVRRAYDHKFSPSFKQKRELNKWPAVEGSEEDDVTTEEDPDSEFWDSDYS